MIAIVGGGLAGLVAAHELARGGNPVTILEGGPRLGGQIWTEAAHGFLIEHGAEGYAAGRQAAPELCRDLDLTSRLVSQLTTHSLILRRGKLVPSSTSEAARLAGIQADRADFGQGITTFIGGMGELVNVLAAALAARATIRLETSAVALAPKAAGWQITTNGGDTFQADAVLLAIPAAAAASLVAPLCPDAGEMLDSFPAVSSVSVSLAVPASAVPHGLDGSGFISEGRLEDEGFRACSFASGKFPGRAPQGFVLLRAFFRPGRGFPFNAPDARWVDLAMQAVSPALGLRGQPVHAWVARWPDALPRYAPDHDARVRAVTELWHCEAPVLLAGAAYRPAGIAGAIESARAAARSLLAATA